MAKYALCIGINDYPGTENDLSGCVNDANDWATALSKRGFATTKMLDKQATGKNMRAAITAAIAKANAGDLVVIQYSGHGSYVPDDDSEEPDGKDECLCPYDINSKGPITDDELFDIYSAKKTGVKLLVISDSCHSGSNARFAPITTPPTIKGKNAPQRKVRFLPPAVFLSKSQLAKLGSSRAMRRSNPPGRHAALLMDVKTANIAMTRPLKAVPMAPTASSRCASWSSCRPTPAINAGMTRSAKFCRRNSIPKRRTYTALRA